MSVLVCKFGGSSLASAEQFKKVGEIIRSDSERKLVVPSAPGKRNNKDTKVISNPYKLKEPENYLKKPIKTPTMEKIDKLKESGEKKVLKKTEGRKETDKEKAQRYDHEINERLIKEMKYYQYLDKVLSDFKKENPKAIISEEENPKMWIIENRKYVTDPNKVINIIKNNPELLKDDDLHKIYIELLKKTKAASNGGSRAERGYKV